MKSEQDCEISLSIVVPCYNEEGILEELLERVQRVAGEVAGGGFELILVDDGSKDRTWEIVESMGARHDWVKGLRLSRNFGHQCALTAGLEIARGECVFIIDADLQDPPELLKPMFDRLQEGFDVVYGQRESREGESWFKLATADAFYRLMEKLSDTRIPRDAGDFRLIRRCVLEAYLSMPERHRFVRGMIAWAGFRQVAFPYARAARKTGETNYPLSKMLRLAVDAITGFSIVPLRFCGILGLLSIFVSFCLLVYVGLSYFVFGSTRGWASIAAIVTFFGSVQLISLSLIGEYIGRSFMELKRRPIYFVSESVNSDSNSTKLGL
ncbi:glycosyltransferase family 2 protein [Pelagicoccus sp. SDUM812005]|uniref:glycosyltransferase family 2 protein n=1 Tax=Pelagicoccus sp. SDUM812005 TaxID=3041257 RepID=UPI00280D5592|nr:glycosyltransferase family 2 protein [Pelagicoccus sp. SDUM812005]MDQ8180875.1 glycosyltransferase family 2 protein [Pelagicoccus sp. SDUM812005]